MEIVVSVNSNLDFHKIEDYLNNICFTELDVDFTIVRKGKSEEILRRISKDYDDKDRVVDYKKVNAVSDYLHNRIYCFYDEALGYTPEDIIYLAGHEYAHYVIHKTNFLARYFTILYRNNNSPVAEEEFCTKIGKTFAEEYTKLKEKGLV